MSEPTRPYVVHVTADYPDEIVQVKTPVIQRLVGLASTEFDQHVISLNRVSPQAAGWIWPRFSMTIEHESDDLTAFLYRAPPKGIHHRRMLLKLGEALAEKLAEGRKPDLLVAHKLTVEGFAVARAADLLAIPYALSVQGNTDAKILRSRPDLARFLLPVWHNACVAFPFTPWALHAVEEKLGRRDGPTHLLPCPLDEDGMIAPVVGGDRIVSAFHLRNHAIKNLGGLVRGLELARAEEPTVELGIVGGGSDADERAARAYPGAEPIFEGPLDHSHIAKRFNGAKGFIMPSHHESFGLVFIEALFAGLPIAYPAGAAVDGYFDGCEFALRVDAKSAESIAQAMLTLHRDEARLKSSLAEWQSSDTAKRFTRPVIGDTFTRGLKQAIGGAA